MKRVDIKHSVREKVQRQKAFFGSREPGLLAYVNRKPEKHTDTDSDNLEYMQGLAGSVYRAVATKNGGFAPDVQRIKTAVEEFVKRHREDAEGAVSLPPGDAIPCVYAHWDIGWHTAAMAELPPRFSKGAWWLEPNMDWEAIEGLEFNPDTPWLLAAWHTHRALWELWDGDFWTIPFIHRSPLDYANGLRGTRLFEEMLTKPERVKRLLDWCVDWQLAAERFVYDGIDVPEGWGVGIMGTWGPDRAVWVNGDPVGLISREMMLEFEQPYTGRLFASTGGGFFHNHTMGLYQADRVAATPGIHMQNFTRDPNRPTVEQTLLDDADSRERILKASLRTPILISSMTPESLQSALPILREGRFMLHVEYDSGDDPYEIVKSIRKAAGVN